MAEPQEGIRQDISEAQYAATSATGNATIQITNYYYREGPESAAQPAAGPAGAADADLPCPYRGLFHFGPDDAALFFGRDAVVESLHQAIGSRAFLPLLGASGSGKSSVVLAGLVPRLQRDGHWRFTHFRPGADPFHAMALAVVPLYAPQLNATERMAQARQLAGFLRSGEVPLPDVLAQVRQNFPDDLVLLIADQFEELYTLGAEDSLRRQFLDTLLAGFPGDRSDARASAAHQARLVLTMRADFLGNALSYRSFADLLQQGDFKLGPMNAEELREVIEKPAAARGVSFESGLVERILEEVEAEPGVLPLLEFALTELWARRKGQTITHGAYSAIGGVEGALTRHADDSYAALSKEQKEEARRVFLQLVRPGEGTEDTRRVATRQELGATPWALVKQLADARLVVTNRGEDAAVETVEVVHEALIRHWGELRGWMASDRSFRTWQERLRSDLARWEASRRDEGLLLRGVALAEGEENLKKREGDLGAAERAFIEASAAAHERAQHLELRRRRLLFGGLGGALAVVTVALLLAWGQLVRAQRQRGEALAAMAMLKVNSRPADALLEGLAAAGLIRYGELRTDASFLPSVVSEALIKGEVSNRERNRLLGHQGRVWSAAFSPDGSLIVSAGQDGTVRLWDTKSGKALGKPLRGHKRGVWSAAFSPDGSRIVSAGQDGTVRLWVAKSGKTMGEPLRGHKREVWSAAFSPDGSRIVSAGQDGTVRLWDAKSGKAMGEPLRGHRLAVWSAAFSPDGSRIVSAGQDGTVRLWDAKSGKALGEPLRGHKRGVWTAAFSPDGSRIVSAGQDETVRQWDAASGKALGVPLWGHQRGVWSAAYSPDGSRIVSAGQDGTARLWDASRGKALGEPMWGHQRGVWSAAFSPDGTRIVSAGEDGTVRLWDSTSGKALGEPLLGHQRGVWSAAFSPDGTRIVSTGQDGTVRLWEAKTGKALSEPLLGHQQGVMSGAFSPDGGRIVSAGEDGTVRLWDVKSGKALGKPLRGHNRGVWSAAFSPDGGRIVSAGQDGTVRLWDSTSGKGLGEPLRGHKGEVWSAAISPDGGRIVSAGEDGTVRLWDAKSGKALGVPLRGHQHGVLSAAFSPNGGRIVSAGQDGTVRLWDSTSGKALGVPLRGHQHGVLSAAFSPNGGRVVSAGEDGTVRLWDATRGKALGVPLRGHQQGVLSAAFSPDGGRIVSSGEDGSVRLWVSAWTDPIRHTCNLLRDHQSLAAPASEAQREAHRACERYGWR